MKSALTEMDGPTPTDMQISLHIYQLQKLKTQDWKKRVSEVVVKGSVCFEKK